MRIETQLQIQNYIIMSLYFYFSYSHRGSRGIWIWRLPACITASDNAAVQAAVTTLDFTASSAIGPKMRKGILAPRRPAPSLHLFAFVAGFKIVLYQTKILGIWHHFDPSWSYSTLWIRRIEHRKYNRGCNRLPKLLQTIAPSIPFPVFNPLYPQGMQERISIS